MRILNLNFHWVAAFGGSTMILVALTLLSGCSLINRRAKRAAAVAASQTYLPPTHAGLGRILSYDAVAGTALVEFGYFAKIPAKLAGQSLISRKSNSLESTARLVASAHRNGPILGVYVVQGTPSINDEVVLPPSP